jgi:nitroreductase
MINYIDAIEARVSVRTYDPRTLESEVRRDLESICRGTAGPFGNQVRLELLDLGGVSREELKSLGTYGVIRGARFYILAAVLAGERTMEDVGFCLERAILQATAIGLGTCWLGGTFRRSSFARQLNLGPGEVLPAITPVGYPAERPSLVERAMRRGARARQRRPWAELFFDREGTPLSPAAAGPYERVLEAVRLGPSASNKQPWRIFREDEGFSLYLAETPGYPGNRVGFKLQQVDMGIAMSHFQLAAEELGLKGRWQPLAAPRKGLAPTARWLPGGEGA